MKYRKKPVVIEDMTVSQILSTQIDRFSTLPSWIQNAIENKILVFDRSSFSVNSLIVKTLEGDMLGNSNDFIIQGVNGELYPCKPDIFELTYEKVEDNLVDGQFVKDAK